MSRKFSPEELAKIEKARGLCTGEDQNQCSLCNNPPYSKAFNARRHIFLKHPVI